MRAWSIMLFTPLLLVGCGSDPESSGTTSGGSGDLAPPAIGSQLVTTETALDGGQERYACWSFDLPADAPLDVTKLETQIEGAGIHHYAVFTNSLAGASDAEAYDCETMGATWGLVSGGGLGTPPVVFPEGTAMELPAGAHIVVQLHLLNATTDAVTIPPVRINLVGAESGEGLAPVGLLIAGTLDIEIPPKTSGVEVAGDCTLTEPLENVFAVFPHMHQLGKRTVATVTPKDGGADRVLSDIGWDFSDQGLYDAKGSAAVGDTVKVTCEYDNPSGEEVGFGLGSADEMCVNVLYFYPATTPSKYCGLTD
jgi:hypothetical protein